MNKTFMICAAAGLALWLSPLRAQRNMTVRELFEQVDKGSVALRERQASVDVASRGVEVAKSRRLPDVDASLSLSYNGNVVMTDRDFGNPHGFSSPHFGNSFALQAQQLVYSGGALSAGIRMAELGKEQAENGVEITRDGQRMLALGLYLDLYKKSNSVRVYEQNIALTERLVEDIEAKQREGMALKNDVTRYGLQLEQLRLGLRRMQDARAVACHQLCNALGIPSTDIQPDTTLASAVYDRKGESYWQQRASSGSPLMRQSDLNIQMAEQDVRLSKADLMPKVAVVAAENFAGPFNYDIPPIDKNFNIWYVGVGVKYSLSSLFKNNKSVRRARAALEQTRENRRLTAQNIDNSMQEAYTLYEQGYANLHTQQKSTELAKQNYDVVRNRYLNQLALVTDMVDASNVLLNAELQEVDARISIVYAYYRLKYIAGEI